MNSSFPNVVNEWNKLDVRITNITSHNAFKNYLLSFIRLLHFDIFGIHKPVGLQLLTRLQLGLSQLNQHKFKHDFRDFLNTVYACNLGSETTSYYLLCCHLFQIKRRTLLNDIKKIDEHIITDPKTELYQILLNGNERYSYDTHRMILLSTITLCIDSKRLDQSLFYFVFR